MNTIFVIIVVIASWLCSLYFIVVAKKCKNKEKEYLNNIELLSKNKKDLRDIIDTRNSLILAKEKTINVLMKILIDILELALLKHKANTINAKFPFVFKDTNLNRIFPLNSIRFKKVENTVFTYINGAMVITDEAIQLENYSCLDFEDYKVYEDSLKTLKRMQKEDISIVELENFLNK